MVAKNTIEKHRMKCTSTQIAYKKALRNRQKRTPCIRVLIIPMLLILLMRYSTVVVQSAVNR